MGKEIFLQWVEEAVCDLSVRGYLAMSGDIFDDQTWMLGILLAFNG